MLTWILCPSTPEVLDGPLLPGIAVLWLNAMGPLGKAGESPLFTFAVLLQSPSSWGPSLSSPCVLGLKTVSGPEIGQDCDFYWGGCPKSRSSTLDLILMFKLSSAPIGLPI